MSVTTPAGGGLHGLSERSGVQRLWRRVSTWLLAYLPERSKVRRPPVRIHAAQAVPAAALRTGVALLGLLCASVVVIGTPSWVVVIALLIGLACAPGTMIGGALVITLGLLMMFDPEPAAVWRTPLLIAAVPLMMQLAAIAAQTTWAGRIELQVLAQPMRRYLAVQVFAQLLGLVGGLVAGLGYVLPQVMALGAVSVLALVVFWLPSLGPARRRD